MAMDLFVATYVCFPFISKNNSSSMITQEPSMSAARTIRESQEYFLALRRAAHRTLFFRDPVPAPRPSEERLNEDLQRREESPSGQLPSGSGSLHESSAVSIKTKKKNSRVVPPI